MINVMEYFNEYISPLGKILMKSDGEYLTNLYFINEKNNYQSINNDNLEIFDITRKWLDIYFEGQIPDFTPKYKMENLTDFRKEVINILLKIPYGKTITYNDIANIIAEKRGIKKMACQAIGKAIGWNPILIIIPCHRVIGKNGNLTGYSGGIENKLKLLKLERNDINKFYFKQEDK